MTVHNLTEGLCPGQLTWVPDSSGIVGMALIAQPYRLGLIFCRSRDSCLFHISLSGDYSKFIITGLKTYFIFWFDLSKINCL